MAFADDLREAGTSQTAILHEFLTQHNPNEERIHAFVEGYEDTTYFRGKLGLYAGPRAVYFYPCHGKRRLYDAFVQITNRVGTYKHILFFADKDLEDILPEAYVLDERIFTTEFYSIENYLVCVDALKRLLLNFVTIKKCVLPRALEMIETKFEHELRSFHTLIRPIMAWIICVRRSGLRPNLNNINMSKIFGIDEELKVCRLGSTISYLCKTTGIPANPGHWGQLRATIRELEGFPAKNYVRGKFEIWFFVEFFKRAMEQLREAAEQCGGSIEVPIMIERANAVALLSGFCPYPGRLESFMQQHLVNKALAIPEGEQGTI